MMLIVVSLLVIGSGILKVNLELAQVVKPSSAFEVTMDKEPLLITLKVGEFKIKFNGGRFENFFRGIEVISETIF